MSPSIVIRLLSTKKTSQISPRTERKWPKKVLPDERHPPRPQGGPGAHKEVKAGDDEAVYKGNGQNRPPRLAGALPEDQQDEKKAHRRRLLVKAIGEQIEKEKAK